MSGLSTRVSTSAIQGTEADLLKVGNTVLRDRQRLVERRIHVLFDDREAIEFDLVQQVAERSEVDNALLSNRNTPLPS